ncbi:MAG: PilZ domain-containing protein [Sphingomonas sp.]|nr:PilZ domain-containing protein [Sphingomonas sp.]
MTTSPVRAKRAFPRSRVFFVTHARLGTESFEVRVRDLSIEGARLEAPNPPPVGTDVHLVYDDLESRCRVTWIDNRVFGVEFHFPLDPSEVPATFLAAAKRTPASKG